MTSKTSKTSKTKAILSETLTALFCKAENDLTALEKAEALGYSAKTTFEGSSEDLLRAILNPGDSWLIAKDSDPYGKVKAAIIDRSLDLKTPIEIPGSIASGKWRAQARESDQPLIRLAGRLAGRLSTLMSKANPNRQTRGAGTGTGTDNDKVSAAWEDGRVAGRAEMCIMVMGLIAAKKTNSEILEEIKAATKKEDRDAAAARIKEALAEKTKKAA